MPRIFAEKPCYCTLFSVSCPNNHNNFCLFNSIKQREKTNERRRKTIKKPCWLSPCIRVWVYESLIVVSFVYPLHTFGRVINTYTHRHNLLLLLLLPCDNRKTLRVIFIIFFSFFFSWHFVIWNLLAFFCISSAFKPLYLFK